MYECKVEPVQGYKSLEVRTVSAHSIPQRPCIILNMSTAFSTLGDPETRAADSFLV